MPLLQVALDLLDLNKAIDIALKVVDYVDLVEAGTPLIKKYGVKAVEELGKNVDKPIVADMKTMDTGYLEASLAYQYGALYTTVLGVAGLHTIREALKARDEYGKGLMIDTIGLWDIPAFIKILEKNGLKPDYILIHSGIDMQHMGVTPFKWLDEVSEYGYGYRYKVGVAGGINIENIHLLQKYKFIELVIVGGWITKSVDPGKAAREIRESLSRLSK